LRDAIGPGAIQWSENLPKGFNTCNRNALWKTRQSQIPIHPQMLALFAISPPYNCNCDTTMDEKQPLSAGLVIFHVFVYNEVDFAPQRIAMKAIGFLAHPRQ
jgi:hypothetical protein